MKPALKLDKVGDQDLATPDRAIIAVACAVKGHADYRPRAVQPVLCHAGRNMGMVVLHANRLQALALCTLNRIARGKVVGMQVVGNRLRLHTEQPLKILHALLEGS